MYFKGGGEIGNVKERGKKLDSKKVDFSTFDALSYALWEIGKGFDHGAKVYGKLNYKEVKPFVDRYSSAGWRHKLRSSMLPIFEADSKIFTRAHLICCEMILLQKELEDYYGTEYPFEWTDEQVDLIEKKRRITDA